MRFLVDENTGPTVAQWLKGQGHEVFSVFNEARGMDDDDIIQKASVEDWIIITSDKDFGEKIYRDNKTHRGVILLRLRDERTPNKILALNQLLDSYSAQLAGNFVVVTTNSVRVAKT